MPEQKTKRPIVGLTAGETLDLTTHPDYANGDFTIDVVHMDGFECRFSARTKGNTEGEKRDRSTDCIFEGGNNAKCLGGMGRVGGPFDIVYCAVGSDAIRCEIVRGTP